MNPAVSRFLHLLLLLVGPSARAQNCGPASYASCAKGLCCSQFNYCGADPAHCGSGCQPLYGNCSAPGPSSNSPPFNPGGCGAINSNKSCQAGYCCSGSWYCGNTAQYCGSLSGCQPDFGTCWNSTPPLAPSSYAASPPPLSSAPTPPPPTASSSSTVGLGLALGLAGALTVLLLVLGLVFRRRILAWFSKRGADRASSQKAGLIVEPRVLSSDIPRKTFTIEQLRAATVDFSDANLLAAGGFGKVYKGILPPSSRDYAGWQVAIKRIKDMEAENSRGEALLESFKKEVELLLGLDHVNVVKLLGYCFEGKDRLLVFQFAERGSLMSLLKKERAKPALPSSAAEICPGEGLTWERRLRLAEGAARGLKYLHFDRNEPILHLDVKSDNILVTSDYTAKVADFGLSKRRALAKGPQGPTEHTLDTGNWKGTRGYADPLFNVDFKMDRSSDVYSFGIVLLEIATDEFPLGYKVDGVCRGMTQGVWMEVNEKGFGSVAAPAIKKRLGECSPLRENEASLHLSPEELRAQSTTRLLFQRLVCLGMWCCVYDRELRPSMDAVLTILHELSLGQSVPGDECCVLEAPERKNFAQGLWSFP